MSARLGRPAQIDLLGLGLFAALTIFDFNRLRRSGMDQSTLIAASIFIDVLNVFQLILLVFGGGGERRR